MKDENDTKYNIASVERALNVLLLIGNANKSLSLQDISNTSRLNKTTVLRILHTLKNQEFITYDSDLKLYSLGTNSLRLGLSALDSIDLVDFANPVLRQLSDVTGLTSQLGVFEKDNVLILSKHIPKNRKHTNELVSKAGAIIPNFCTGIGLLFLAHESDNKVNEILEKTELKQYTSTTIFDMNGIWSQIKEIRANGCQYAFNDGEHDEGIVSYCYPVYDFSEKMVAGISICGTREAVHYSCLSNDSLNKGIEAAKVISVKLGWKNKDNITGLD